MGSYWSVSERIVGIVSDMVIVCEFFLLARVKTRLVVRSWCVGPTCEILGNRVRDGPGSGSQARVLFPEMLIHMALLSL